MNRGGDGLGNTIVSTPVDYHMAVGLADKAPETTMFQPRNNGSLDSFDTSQEWNDSLIGVRGDTIFTFGVLTKNAHAFVGYHLGNGVGNN